MSDYVQNPNTGVIFRNDNKTGNQPDYRGKGADAQGNPVEIALWVKESKAGVKYFTYKISEPFVPTKQAEAPATPESIPNDDLPF